MQLERISLWTWGFFLMHPAVRAQEGSIWYFGDHAGVQFAGNTTIPLANGELYSIECTTTMTDAIGNLLFYSNGGPLGLHHGKVWNSAHTMMPNGDLDMAGGCLSSNQGAIAVRRPGSASQYYLFTTDCAEHVYEGGLRYSIVDMDLDGGLGDVTAKGIPIQGDVTESIALVRAANGTDVWLIAQELSGVDMLAFLVDADTIHPPVHSTVFSSSPAVGGTLSVNYDGDRVCHADPGGAHVLAFDNATGSMDTLLTIPGQFYGSAFSPTCRFLYLLEWALPRHIFQYDLNSADIPGSVQGIGFTPSGVTGSLAIQIGPNGKLYMPVWNHSYLNAIEHPDLPGLACELVDSAVYVGTGECWVGLPNFVNDIYGPCKPGSLNGVLENKGNTSVRLSPVPAHDRVQLAVGVDHLPARMRMTDLTGKVLDDRSITHALTDVALGPYSPGTYVIRVSGVITERSLKLVIE